MEKEICKVNTDDYLIRRTSRSVDRDWWLATSTTCILIKHLPVRFHGKHIKVKIEIVEDQNGNVSEDNLL